MKGLILKDFYCLRVSVKTVICASAFSFFLCIMCILSIQYGNLAKLPEEIAKEGVDMADAGVLWRMLLSVFIFLPTSLAGYGIQCFQEDKRAGFGKVEASLPLSAAVIVTARFGSILLFGGVTFGISACLALVSGMLSPDFTVAELLGFNITLAGVLFATNAVTAFVMYVVDSKWVEMLLALPVFAAVFVMNFCVVRSEEGMETLIFEDIIRFVESKSRLVAVLGIGVAVCAYIGSVLVVRRKRGTR
ncbi:MAG: ABC-2 transporter permease [Acetatifactor sp.]|nr:ABC-2 transporter permease [Acetatifactor sp.]